MMGEFHSWYGNRIEYGVVEEDMVTAINYGILERGSGIGKNNRAQEGGQ